MSKISQNKSVEENKSEDIKIDKYKKTKIIKPKIYDAK